MGHNKKILYVEDDPFMQDLVRVVVERAGPYDLHICSSGQEALDELRHFVPDLILLDKMMPGLQGTHTMHIIRISPECQNVPIIFITSHASPEDCAQYKALGAASVIAKPFMPEELVSIIRQNCKP